MTKPQQFGFDGQLTDKHTTWQFLGRGYRAYNPELHRFMAEDSLSPFDKGGINGYLFAHNNPSMLFDPSGHISTGFISLLVGIGLSLGVYGVTLLGAYAGGNTALTYLSRALFVAGNSMPAFYQAGEEFSQHKNTSGLSDILVALSGVLGVVSAQPGLMLGEVSSKTRNTAVMISSTLSQLTMGAAVGVKSNIAEHANKDQLNQIGLSIYFGFLGGIFYGQISKKIFDSAGEDYIRQMFYGSIRTGITGFISSAPAFTYDIINGKYTGCKFYVDYGVPFIMGAISGITQKGYDEGLRGLASSPVKYKYYAGFGLARLSYLFVKPPLWGAFASGQFFSFFKS